MIRFFKLINGEEVIAEVNDDQGAGWEEVIEMRKPMRNMMTNQGPVLITYPCERIKVNVHHILFDGEPNDDVCNAYRKCTGGIVMPSHKFQLPDPLNNSG